MKKLEIGTKVRIREDLIEGEEYGSLVFYKDMVKLRGCEGIIEKIAPHDRYFVRTNEGINYYWSAEMLEPCMNDCFYS